MFRYNSSMGSMAFTGECGEGGCRPASVIANVMPWNPSLCADGVSYSHNVLKGGSCGSTDASVDRLAFAAAERFDLHLAPASPAHCMGDPASIPETDIDGEPRGRGRRPDAGADQVPAPDPLPSRCRLPGS